jgi:amino acid permease
MFGILVYISFLLVIEIAQNSDNQTSTFADMGAMLFGGIAVAIGAALIVAFFMMKLQKRKATSSDFISINPSEHD